MQKKALLEALYHGTNPSAKENYRESMAFLSSPTSDNCGGIPS
jgi:hypothetical protein